MKTKKTIKDLLSIIKAGYCAGKTSVIIEQTIKDNNKKIAIALAKKELIKLNKKKQRQLFNNKYHTVDINKEQLNNK